MRVINLRCNGPELEEGSVFATVAEAEWGFALPCNGIHERIGRGKRLEEQKGGLEDP